MAPPPYLLALFGAHATCSVSMTLLNKTIAQGFDFPWTVLFIQNVGTLVIGYLYPLLTCKLASSEDRGKTSVLPIGSTDVKPVQRRICGMKVPTALKNKLWVVVQVSFFMVQLFISLKALKYISVPLYVVARNTVPAQTALLERIFTGVQLSFVGFVGLIWTVVGAAVYTYGDMSSGLDTSGFVIAAVLTLNVACCSVVDKTAVRILGQEEDIKPVECNQIRVALALPLNLLLMLATEFGHARGVDTQTLQGGVVETAAKADIYTASMNMPTAVYVSVLLSTIFGFGMGTFNFCLQQAVSAATVQVANILYKLTTTIISRVTHPTPVTTTSWVGFAISLSGIALYTFGPKFVSSASKR